MSRNLKPGDAVRTTDGHIGVVERILETPENCALVWLMNWVARNPPVLERVMCSLEALNFVPHADRGGEIFPGTPSIGRERYMHTGWDTAIKLADTYKDADGIFVELVNDGDRVVVAFCGEPFAREVVWANPIRTRTVNRRRA